MPEWRPNATYDHIYAIIRIDEDESIPLTDRIVGKTGFIDRDKAIAEVERLNQLNSEKGCVYTWVVVRM